MVLLNIKHLLDLRIRLNKAIKRVNYRKSLLKIPYTVQERRHDFEAKKPIFESVYKDEKYQKEMKYRVVVI